MANDLVPSQPWTPPESAFMQKVVKYGGIGALGLGGMYAVLAIGPTMLTVAMLLNYIFASLLHTALTGAALIAVLWLIRETLSPDGGINKLLRLPYWMLVNGLTKFFINIDPLSPITERLNAVRSDQALFEKQFETLDGLIQNLHDKEDRARALSQKYGRIGAQAQKAGDKAALDVAGHNFGTYKDAADAYAATRARIEPIRATFQQISQACDVTAQKLEIDRSVLADKWEMQKAVGAATAAANRILGRSKTQVWDMAQQAEELVDTKYSEELGHLDHLKRCAEPFLQSINLEDASYNEDMLAQIQQTAPKLIQSTQATPMPAPTMVSQSDVLAGLIR